MLLISIIILFFSQPATAADKWDKIDISLGVAATALKVLDWRQTKFAMESGNYFEMNPLLGRYPSQNKIDAYFALSSLLQFGIAHYLPSVWRKAWLIGWVGLSGNNVYRNYEVGIGFRF